MAVYYCFRVRPRFVDFTVDESLQRTCAGFGIDGIRVEIVFHDVFSGHQAWREPAGHQVTVRIVRMPDAHVTKGIEYAFLGKNAIGHDKVLDKSRIDRASRGRWCLRAKWSRFDRREY